MKQHFFSLTARASSIIVDQISIPNLYLLHFQAFFIHIVVPVVERNLLVFSETFSSFVLPHCVDPVPDPHRRERESDTAQLIATLDRFG